MNLLQLVIKQMRQRALSSSLTLFSIVLGVGLAIAIMVFYREGGALFGQSDFGYDLIVGPKGSSLQLVLNTSYHLDRSPGIIPYSIYEELRRNPAVRFAVPFAVGDEYKGYRVVGTTQYIFPIDNDGQPHEVQARVFQYRRDKAFEFASGRPFHPDKFEAVIGDEVAAKTGLKLGDKFKAQHDAGSGRAEGDEHDEQWTVVGILKKTQTAQDKAIFIPLVSFYAIPQHEKALEEMEKFRLLQEAIKSGKPLPESVPATKPATTQAGHAHEHEHAYSLFADGTIDLHLPRNQWKVSAIAVRTKGGGFWTQTLIWRYNNGPDAQAAVPAMIMREFFDNFLKAPSLMLLCISVLVTIVAAVGILVSIYNSVIGRLKEIAILRALGATRARILAIICTEAGLLGVAGCMIGMVVGHLLSAGVSSYLVKKYGTGIAWLSTGQWEWIYLGMVVLLVLLAGLVPALKAYRTPVATNLVM